MSSDRGRRRAGPRATTPSSSPTAPATSSDAHVPRVNNRVNSQRFSQNTVQIWRIYPYPGFYSSQRLSQKPPDVFGGCELRAAPRQDLVSPLSVRQHTAPASFPSCILIWKSIFGVQTSFNYRNARGCSDVSAAAGSRAPRTPNTPSASGEAVRPEPAFLGAEEGQEREQAPTVPPLPSPATGVPRGQGPPAGTGSTSLRAKPQEEIPPTAWRASDKSYSQNKAELFFFI